MASRVSRRQSSKAPLRKKVQQATRSTVRRAKHGDYRGSIKPN